MARQAEFIRLGKKRRFERLAKRFCIVKWRMRPLVVWAEMALRQALA